MVKAPRVRLDDGRCCCLIPPENGSGECGCTGHTTPMFQIGVTPQSMPGTIRGGCDAGCKALNGVEFICTYNVGCKWKYFFDNNEPCGFFSYEVVMDYDTDAVSWYIEVKLSFVPAPIPNHMCYYGWWSWRHYFGGGQPTCASIDGVSCTFYDLYLENSGLCTEAPPLAPCGVGTGQNSMMIISYIPP